MHGHARRRRCPYGGGAALCGFAPPCAAKSTPRPARFKCSSARIFIRRNAVSRGWPEVDYKYSDWWKNTANPHGTSNANWAAAEATPCRPAAGREPSVTRGCRSGSFARHLRQCSASDCCLLPAHATRAVAREMVDRLDRPHRMGDARDVRQVVPRDDDRYVVGRRCRCSPFVPPPIGRAAPGATQRKPPMQTRCGGPRCWS